MRWGDAPQDRRPAYSLPLNSASAAIGTIFQLTNQDRAAQGLRALAWSPELASAAGAHASLMAGRFHRELSHRYPGEPDLATRISQAGAHFSSVAENIAYGQSGPQLESAWMHSPPHRANILDPRMNAIGIAIVASGGMLYAVEDFAAAVTQLSPAAVEQRVEAELAAFDVSIATASPGDTLPAKEETRKNCQMETGRIDGSTPGFIIRWQGADLSLPQPLVEELRSRKYSWAAVGACAANTADVGGFTAYRVAVLLF